MHTVFKWYVGTEVGQETLEEPVPQPSVRRRHPGKSSGATHFEDTMAVNLHLLTDFKSQK